MPHETQCVEARFFPSELKAAAIVEFGGSPREQYFADKCCNGSPSTFHEKKIGFKTRSFLLFNKERNKEKKTHEEIKGTMKLECVMSLLCCLRMRNENTIYFYPNVSSAKNWILETFPSVLACSKHFSLYTIRKWASGNSRSSVPHMNDDVSIAEANRNHSNTLV